MKPEDMIDTATSKEQLMARVCELMRSAQLFVMGSVDESGHLIVSSMGLRVSTIPAVLRDMAAQLEREEHVRRVRETVDALPPDRKATCPGCAQQVIVTTPIPFDAIEHSSKRAVCVCTCGAFLIPQLGEGRAMLLRYMTDIEISELPDEVRNNLLRMRRDFERLRAEYGIERPN